MMSVASEGQRITVTIDTEGMDPGVVQELLDRLRFQALASKSKLSKQDAWELSEEVTRDWWDRNQARFNDRQR